MKQYLKRFTTLFSKISYIALGAALVVPSLALCIVCLALAVIFDAASFSLSR